MRQVPSFPDFLAEIDSTMQYGDRPAPRGISLARTQQTTRRSRPPRSMDSECFRGKAEGSIAFIFDTNTS
jgi:hypothetical protein